MNADEDRILELAELAEVGLAAASLVHELRQPLFAVRALAQLGAEGGGLDPDQLGELLGALDHLDGVLSAWGEVGRQEPARLLDVAEVVDEVGRLLAGRARQAGAHVDLRLEGPVWAWGSPSAARQVVLNLLQNALDAVASSPIREVVVRVVQRGDRVGVEVDDTGPGVLDGERVFEPFFTTKGRGGTGLGLWVARRLCEAAGGRLDLRPRPVGTRAEAQFASSVEPAVAVGGPMKNA